MRGARGSPAAEDRVITTVLFTDIVGSTELATELGDRQWRQVLAMHHALVRGFLRRYGGREIDTAGDGFFATFDQPARAIRCACEVADGLWTRGLIIRAGLHIGEVERKGGKVGGVAVHIGSRVASAARPGEVLVSGTMRDLVSGSDLRFIDRGSQTLKGVPGEWHLFAVARDGAPEGVPDTAPPPLGEQAIVKRRWYQRRGVLGLGAVLAAAVLGAAVYALASPTGLNPIVPGPDSVALLDPAADRFVASVEVGHEPSAAVEGAGSVWVLNADDQTVSRVDPASRVVVATRAVGGTPTGITFGAGSVWVAAGFGLTSGAEGSVLELDPATNELGRPIAVGNGLSGITFGYGSIWVTNKNDNTVVRLDPDTGGITTIPVAAGPEGIAVGGGSVWVAASLTPILVRIDPETNRVANEIPIRHVSNAIAASDDAVWAVSTAANVVTRIDPFSGTIVTTIEVTGGPVSAAITEGAAWVAAPGAQSVIRIDTEINEQSATVSTHGRPWGMVAVNNQLWVTVRP